MSLSTEFMGLQLDNPIIVAAGPWSGSGNRIKKALEAGAGAVVTETIVNEVNIDVRPRIAYQNKGVQNIRWYSDLLLEQWEEEIQKAKSLDGIIIANVCAQTPSEVSYIAGKMERAGADAIELGLASPMGEGLEVMTSSPERIYEMTSRVVKDVDIPVMVKLSQNVTNMPKVAAAVEKAGGSGISAIDTVRCILNVDVNNRKPSLSAYGGYSGAPIRPLGLASVASIAQSTQLPICGIGGIETGENILEYMMLGATAVQVGTALMLNGFSYIEKLKEELLEWMDANNVNDFAQIRGEALSNIKSFDEFQVEPKVAKISRRCTKAECNRCVKGCIYEAITMGEDGISIDESLCRGCGLCMDICPEELIELDWQ